MDVRSAITKINKRGILLVYPIQNRPDPASLWTEFYPRSEMRWEWDDGSDNRVANLWRLRERLSCSGKVVYSKWYQNRATFFSHEVFPLLVAASGANEGHLSPAARQVLRVLEEDSPLSTKELKRRTGLVGKRFEKDYDRALKELWKSFFIVGYGEVDDGAFPSLAVGAASLLFSDLWGQAQRLDAAQAEKALTEKVGADSLFYKFYLKIKAAPMAPLVKRSKGTIRYEDLIKK
jgi:hypothetical protein